MNKILTTLLVCAVAVPGVYAAKNVTKDNYRESGLYVFPRQERIYGLMPYGTTVYTATRGAVQTLRGDEVYTGKDSVISAAVNPTGISIALVTKGKKENKLRVYASMEMMHKLFELNNKKYGNPTSVAYLPDGRSMAVACGGKLLMLDPRSYEPLREIAGLPFTPSKMIVSGNGYYLALCGGKDNKDVAVYNLESGKIRKQLSYDEPVSGMAFAPQSDAFGVLSDGLLSIYNTRTFDVDKMVDDLGEAKDFAYNFDGKYVAVVTGDNKVSVINMLRDSDRSDSEYDFSGTSKVAFVYDANNNTIMAANTDPAMVLKRMPNLHPYYQKLISEEVDRKMDEWLKMQPGESMEAYRERVTEESRARQRRLYEDEIATGFAGNLVDGDKMSLGQYDRANGVLALNFESMPAIYIPVPENEVGAFTNVGDLTLSNVMYGVMPDDSFEVVYADVLNRSNGKSYTYDNRERKALDYMSADDAISLELLQQQQMEELRLDELRKKVVAEAKDAQVISDHTQISVSSKVVPDYDADGNKILNYMVTFTYNVEPEYSAVEDFAPGKYHVEESGAASSMMKIVKEAFEGDMKQYLDKKGKVNVNLKGTADAMPILRGIPYDGSFGEIEDEPVYKNGQLSAISVNTKEGIKQNEQLALVRALGVKDYLEKNVAGYKDANTNYRYDVNVSEGKGGQYRRITAEFTFVDVF